MIKFGDSILLFGSKKCLSCLCLEEKLLRLGIPKEQITYLDINLDRDIFSAFNVKVIPTLIIPRNFSRKERRLIGDTHISDIKNFLKII